MAMSIVPKAWNDKTRPMVPSDRPSSRKYKLRRTQYVPSPNPKKNVPAR